MVCASVHVPRYYLELNTKQRKEWEQRLEELKKAAEEEVGSGQEIVGEEKIACMGRGQCGERNMQTGTEEDGIFGGVPAGMLSTVFFVDRNRGTLWERKNCLHYIGRCAGLEE